MGSQESEPLLVNAAPGRRLYDGGDPNRQASDAISVEQRALALQLQAEIAGRVADFADKIIAGLSVEEIFEGPYAFTQGEAAGTGAVAQPGGKILQMPQLARGGTWKIAAVVALGLPTNSADLTVQLNELVRGFPVAVAAPRQNPSERALNLPVAQGGSFSAIVTGGAAGDVVGLYLRLTRYGAQLGGGGRI